MNRIVLVALFFCASALSLGCGGGGGGGGDTSHGVRILHGAVDAVPVDIYSSTAAGVLLQRATFASTQTYVRLDSGTQTLSLTRGKTPAVSIRDFNVEVDGSSRFSVLLYGDNSTFGLSARILDDTLPEERGDGALLRVVNGMTGASEIVFSVGTSAAPGSSIASSRIGFGSASAYLKIPAGPLRVTSQRAADKRVVSAINFDFQAGSAYTVFLAGEADYYVKGVVLAD